MPRLCHTSHVNSAHGRSRVVGPQIFIVWKREDFIEQAAGLAHSAKSRGVLQRQWFDRKAIHERVRYSRRVKSAS